MLLGQTLGIIQSPIPGVNAHGWNGFGGNSITYELNVAFETKGEEL